MTGQPISEGLTTEQARILGQTYGKNRLTPEKRDNFFLKLLHVLGEPMFLLLIVAAVIYFILGEPRDGAIMLIFVMGIISIDVIQQWKTDRTLQALKQLAAPRIKVLRDGRESILASEDLVPGDVMLVEEGVKIPADGRILRVSDLCVDESSLTGEAEGVWKVCCGDEVPADYWRRDTCYAGTLAIQGSAYVLVEKIGADTEYGKIGAGVAAAPENPTPLTRQTGRLVKLCAGLAAVLFALVGCITYFNIPDHTPGARIIESILSGITLAMAMIPEEFPVILTVFLSMGAWRLARRQSLVRRLPAVETLGSVTVLCVDKTGTITMNQMTVQQDWSPGGDRDTLAETMGLACEMDAYDPMEQAMLAYCEGQGFGKNHLFGGELVAEYPFTNERKMMGHVWEHDGGLLVAAKGSPEGILPLCGLTQGERTAAEAEIARLSGMGLRVIAVGRMGLQGPQDIPDSLADCRLTLCGLVGLADPPRPGIAQQIARCERAGVRVVMITGDNGLTAGAIARQIGMEGTDRVLTGAQLDAMDDTELERWVRDVAIFSRVVPEHKMRIVRALQRQGEVVAMTGDGVNDAPALKYADIGVAMGKRGSEVSREAADLILLDDNFGTIVDTIADGRRIYDNIRKAVGYVFTIHIPIAAASLLAPLIGIAPANLLLLPLHVVLLELVIDPTCSIILERQPAEPDIMERPPRRPDQPILTVSGLLRSVLQGAVMFMASFGAYFVLLRDTGNAPLARSMGLAILLLGNMLLVQTGSSQRTLMIHCIRRLIRDRVTWAVSLGTLALLLVILYTPLNGFLKLAPLSPMQLLAAAGIAAVSVLWVEGIKLARILLRRRA